MIMRSIFTQASVQLHFLCFCFIRLFCFFFFGFLHHCHCETTPLQEDIITHTSGVTSHYIVLHPVSSRASRTSGLCVQVIYYSWLVDYRNIRPDFSQRRYFGLFKGIHRIHKWRMRGKKLALGIKTRRFRINKKINFACEYKAHRETIFFKSG